ncbi:MAG: MarR family winged helix-turn-helix transcriptional regulator [Sphingomonas sp.]
MTRAPDPSPLDASLGYWLRSASNQVSHGVSQKLAARDVTAAEWVLLRMIYAHDVGAPNRLARDLGMTKGAISKLVDRLVGKGLAVKAPMASDRRHQDVWLTPVGRALVPELAAMADANEAEYFSHLSVVEREMLETLLRGIVQRRGISALGADQDGKQ